MRLPSPHLTPHPFPHSLTNTTPLNNNATQVSAYFLTQAPLILVYGQVLRFFATKWVFIVAVALFELGSLVCGVANSANVLIFGRAFAGVGAAGIFVSK